MDTIFAVSSGLPPAAIAIVRVSGPAAADALVALGGRLPTPRLATLRRVRDATGALLDQALLLWFPGPDSVTGEDLAELHLHGGRATVAAVERALAALPALRCADPGEFTRRALYNGRIDLTEAEGLADLLEAEGEEARRRALLRMEGHLSRLIRGWIERLSEISADVEAAIDYADEVEVADPLAIERRITELTGEWDGVLAGPVAEEVRDGYRVALTGPVNSGKSSLFNALVGRDAAIVSPLSGTTRDVLEARVVRGGMSFVVTDTAGLRADTSDPIERIGIARGQAEAAAAHLVIWLGDDAPPEDETLAIHARSDVPRSGAPIDRPGVSIADPASVVMLWNMIAARAARTPRLPDVLLQRMQHAALTDARDSVANDVARGDMVLLAEGLRHARIRLSALLGINATEAMLDQLFSRFCVGK